MTSSRSIVRRSNIKEAFCDFAIILHSVLSFSFLFSTSLRLPRSLPPSGPLPPDPTCPKAEKVNGGNGPHKTHYEVCRGAHAPFRQAGKAAAVEDLPAASVAGAAAAVALLDVTAENFYHHADKMAQCRRSSSRGSSSLLSTASLSVDDRAQTARAECKQKVGREA